MFMYKANSGLYYIYGSVLHSDILMTIFKSSVFSFKILVHLDSVITMVISI